MKKNAERTGGCYIAGFWMPDSPPHIPLPHLKGSDPALAGQITAITNMCRRIQIEVPSNLSQMTHSEAADFIGSIQRVITEARKALFRSQQLPE